MGWAFPASLGIKCGVPERPVICFTGDGGFYYHLQEMETAVRYGIKTITVINNNRMLAQCHHYGTLQVYGDDQEKGTGIVAFSPISFANIAREFGLLAICVEKPDDIKPAIQKALASDIAAVIDVRTAAHVQPLPNLE